MISARALRALSALWLIVFTRPVWAQESGQINIICSVQAEWCHMIQTVFARSTGIKVNLSLKGSGEALAQLSAERANPKTDVWFGGTGDPHLQAAGPGEAAQGFPVATVTPTEGTGAEIGSMSVLKGARNLENAKKFYEWALTLQAQQFGAASRQYQLPANKATAVDTRVPDFKKIKFVEYDYAKYGASAERRRLIARWEKEINSLPR